MKNIVLLSDGTGNSAAKKNKTNVWRLYTALKLHLHEQQIAMYDDGVGSKDSTLSKVLGGAFGIGLKRNVLELYKYLCRNYKHEENDRIYLFGFSRGAFTVRLLADFVAEAGLCTKFETEKELDHIAEENFRAYRSQSKRGIRHGLLYRLVTLFRKKPKKTSNVYPDIYFMGVWDTVDAYVMPMDELSRLWDFWIFPIRFDDLILSEKVKRACHAISVDDERLTFHPVMWDETHSDKPDRIEQVWFPGVHTDVGGGYARPSLSLVTLDWMLSKVEGANDDPSTGLIFLDSIRKQYCNQSDWNGPQHNSRSGLATYYRYKPRNIADIYKDAGMPDITPKIHRSVFERCRGRATPYAPTGIPAAYRVAATDKKGISYETPEEAEKRVFALSSAQDCIFWRRVIYFAFLLFTLALVTSPLYLDWEKGGVCSGSACSIDPVMRFFVASLPDFATGWFEALRQNPNWLWFFVITFFLLVSVRSYALRKTRYHAMCAWAALKKGKDAKVPVKKAGLTSLLRKFIKTPLAKRINRLGVLGIFLLLLYLIIAFVNGTSFYLGYTWGFLCDGTPSAQVLNSERTVELDASNACFGTGLVLERGKTYRFDVADTTLHDGPGYETDADGFAATAMFAFIPLQRHIGQPWLRLYGKIDEGGYETFALGKGAAEYTARSDGELFLYINDAVLGWWPEWDFFYTSGVGPNRGSVKVTVSRIEQ